MTVPPTYDDARLLLQLYEMRREPRLREARAWFVASFHAHTLEELRKTCPAGSPEGASYRMVATYWDMAASLVASGVLNRDLFYQNNREMLLVWARLREIVPLVRESNHDATWLANLETIARDYIDWWERRSPGDHAAFAARTR
jgi:hypothetical protein